MCHVTTCFAIIIKKVIQCLLNTTQVLLKTQHVIQDMPSNNMCYNLSRLDDSQHIPVNNRRQPNNMYNKYARVLHVMQISTSVITKARGAKGANYWGMEERVAI
jgi:hypothetical protein